MSLLYGVRSTTCWIRFGELRYCQTCYNHQELYDTHLEHFLIAMALAFMKVSNYQGQIGSVFESGQAAQGSPILNGAFSVGRNLQATWAQVMAYRKYLAGVAMQGSSAPWPDLLPPTAQTNLFLVQSMDKVKEALKHNEVATNLDQCPDHQEHIGTHMPTILASISHMCFGKLWMLELYSWRQSHMKLLLFRSLLVAHCSS